MSFDLSSFQRRCTQLCRVFKTSFKHLQNLTGGLTGLQALHDCLAATSPPVPPVPCTSSLTEIVQICSLFLHKSLVDNSEFLSQKQSTPLPHLLSLQWWCTLSLTVIVQLRSHILHKLGPESCYSLLDSHLLSLQWWCTLSSGTTSVAFRSLARTTAFTMPCLFCCRPPHTVTWRSLCLCGSDLPGAHRIGGQRGKRVSRCCRICCNADVPPLGVPHRCIVCIAC